MLPGTWIAASAVIGGNALPTEKVQNLRLILTDERYTTKMGEQILFDGNYRTDTSVVPSQIDIYSTESGSEKGTAPGIYRLDGDKLELCYDLSGKERPKDFVSRPGTAVQMTVWNRPASATS